MLWIYGLSFLLLAYVFAGPWRRARVLTDAELVELRYGGRGALTLRACKALYYGGVLNGAALAMVVVGAVRFTEVFMPWHAWLPEAWFSPVLSFVRAFGGEFVAIGGAAPDVAGADALLSLVMLLGFTALYSLTGLRAVVATDVVQLAIMLVGTVLYAGAVLAAVGGPEQITAALVAGHGEAQAHQWLSLGQVTRPARRCWWCWCCRGCSRPAPTAPATWPSAAWPAPTRSRPAARGWCSRGCRSWSAACRG
ncbi:sodium:solute symporter family transporter [Nannocystis pusilla]|uniref:sodium:solute symporter family transporter n=1 Tax=Nannocystis pusilla TaxID=889268 RepID=UPI003B79EFD2